MQEKTWVLAIDADGCIYNHVYTFVLLYILDKYDELLTQCSQGKIEADYLFNLIEKDIQNLHLTDTKKNGVFLNPKLLKQGSRALRHLMEKDGENPNQEERHFRSRYMARKKTECLEKINAFGEDGKKFSKLILLWSNKPLIDAITHLAIASHYKKLIVVSGSNRQSQSLDDDNSAHNGTGLFRNDLPLFQEILDDLLSPYGITVVYDSFTTTKIYPDEEPVFDRTKFTLLYALLHYFGGQIKGPLPLTFIDDRDDIRDSLATAFNINSLIREGMELTIWPYNGSLRFNFNILPGKGPVDANYKENILTLVALCEEQKKEETKQKADDYLDVARELSMAQIQEFALSRVLTKPLPPVANAHSSFFANNNKIAQNESIFSKLRLGH